MSDMPPNEESLSIAARLRVDQACDRFEDACKAGQRSRIEDFLGDAQGPEREALLHGLRQLELSLCPRQGEAIDASLAPTGPTAPFLLAEVMPIEDDEQVTRMFATRPSTAGEVGLRPRLPDRVAVSTDAGARSSRIATPTGQSSASLTRSIQRPWLVGQAERAWRWGRRNPVASLVAVVALLLLAVAGVSTCAALRPNTAHTRKEGAERSTTPRPQHIEMRPTEKVGEIRRFLGHRGAVYAVPFSRDGQLAASGGGGQYLGRGNEPSWLQIDDYAVRLWDVKTGKELRQFVGHTNHVTGLAFSPDGSLLASAGSLDQTVRVWDVATGKELLCLRGHNARVGQVAFLPDGRHIVTPGHDGLVRLWDVKSGKEVRTFEGHQGPIDAVTVSSDGRRVLSGGQDRTVRLWDVASGKELRQFSGHTDCIQTVAFSLDGGRALSGSIDRSIRLWDIGTGEELRRFEGHTDIVQCVAFFPDGRWALSGSFDGTVCLWEVETGKELHCFTGHTSAVFGIAISSDGRHALSGSNDKTVRLWRLHDPPAAKDKR